jgi:hypothetical protein
MEYLKVVTITTALLLSSCARVDFQKAARIAGAAAGGIAHPDTGNGCGLNPTAIQNRQYCDEMKPVCTCGVNGDDCHWVWICVR